MIFMQQPRFCHTDILSADIAFLDCGIDKEGGNEDAQSELYQEISEDDAVKERQDNGQKAQDNGKHRKTDDDGGIDASAGAFDTADPGDDVQDKTDTGTGSTDKREPCRCAGRSVPFQYG